jgi:hypothetical protein
MAMQTIKRMTAAVVAAAMIGGCASGGGGGGSGSATATYADGSTRELTLEELLFCLFGLCPGSPNESTTTSAASTSSDSTSAGSTAPGFQGSTTSPSSPVTFTRWQDTRPDASVSVRGPQAKASFTSSQAGGALGLATSPTASGNGSALVTYGESEALKNFYTGRNFMPGIVAKGFNGGREIDVVWERSSSTEAVFTNEPYNVALVANPYELGWDYQSFGAWSETKFPSANATALSYGAPTPSSAVPTTGSATFRGKLAGLYVSPAGSGWTVGANLGVSVNFSERSLSFASDKTIVTRGPQGSSTGAVPHLSLSGTLAYSPTSNMFSGTLVNAGGTMSGTSNGQFYGPAAQELGGVFALKSATTVETFVGAYGAKR